MLGKSLIDRTAPNADAGAIIYLRKQVQPPTECSDKPAQAKSETDLVITPAMIEAGVCVLWESGRFDPVGDPDRLLVRGLLKAALSQRQRRA